VDVVVVTGRFGTEEGPVTIPLFFLAYISVFSVSSVLFLVNLRPHLDNIALFGTSPSDSPIDASTLFVSGLPPTLVSRIVALNLRPG
jgi:hypothetical protein